MKKLYLLILASVLALNSAFSQPIVSVWGVADSLAMKRQVIQYLQYLDVQENVYVLVNFTTSLPEKLEGMTYPLRSPITQTGQVIRVKINARLRERQRRKVLAHEMVHVKQYAKGELSVIDQQWILWKGQKYFYHRSARNVNPWEREAYRMDRLVAEAAGTPTTPSVDRLIAKRTRP